MATSALPLLLLLSLLAATASARPCKTFFYFSATTTTTTTTYYPQNSLPANPNPSFTLRHRNPRYVTFIFTSTTANSFADRRPKVDFKSDPSIGGDSQSSQAMTSSDLPLKFYSTVSSSIRDRTKDIMSVVGALLLCSFGRRRYCSMIPSPSAKSTRAITFRHSVRKNASKLRDLKLSDFEPKEETLDQVSFRRIENHPTSSICRVPVEGLQSSGICDPADYMLAICGDDALRELSSPGKSGSFFY